MEQLLEAAQCAVEGVSKSPEAKDSGNGSCIRKDEPQGDPSTEQSPLGKRKRPHEEEDDEVSPAKKLVRTGFLVCYVS